MRLSRPFLIVAVAVGAALALYMYGLRAPGRSERPAPGTPAVGDADGARPTAGVTPLPESATRVDRPMRPSLRDNEPHTIPGDWFFAQRAWPGGEIPHEKFL